MPMSAHGSPSEPMSLPMRRPHDVKPPAGAPRFVLDASGKHFLFMALVSCFRREIDIADIDDMEANGILEDLILHEMGHAIGTGLATESSG